MPPPYLLDTDHCVAYLEPTHPGYQNVKPQIDAMSAADLRISVLTVMELSEGPWHSQTNQGYHQARASLHNFLSWITVLQLNHLSIEEFGRLRAQLRRRGQLIEDMDLGIAATALAHNLTLVTHNTRHFRRIPGLRLEDWMP